MKLVGIFSVKVRTIGSALFFKKNLPDGQLAPLGCMLLMWLVVLFIKTENEAHKHTDMVGTAL